MTKTAIAKRVGGASLLLGLAVAAFFTLRPMWRWFVDNYNTSAVNALSVVGVHASREAAGDFLGWLLFVLVIVFGMPGRRPAKAAK